MLATARTTGCVTVSAVDNCTSRYKAPLVTQGKSTPRATLDGMMHWSTHVGARLIRRLDRAELRADSVTIRNQHQQRSGSRGQTAQISLEGSVATIYRAGLVA